MSPVACDRELGMDVFEAERRGCLGFSGAAQKCGRCFAEPGVMQEQAREFAARVAADACDGSTGCGGVRGGLFEYVRRCGVNQDSLRFVSSRDLLVFRRDR